MNPGANQLYPGMVINTPGMNAFGGYTPPGVTVDWGTPPGTLPTGPSPYSSFGGLPAAPSPLPASPLASTPAATPLPANPFHDSVAKLNGWTPAYLISMGYTYNQQLSIWTPPGTKPVGGGGGTPGEYNPAANYSGGGAYPFEWGGPSGPTAKGRNWNIGGGKGRGSGRMEAASPASNYRMEVTAENAAQYPGVPIGSILIRDTTAYAPYGAWKVYNPDGTQWTPGQGAATTQPGIVEPPYTGYNYSSGYNGWQGAYPGYYTPTFSKTGRKKSTPEGLITWRR